MDLRLAVFYSLVTALLWGVGPVLYKKFYERFSSYFGYLVDALFGSTLILFTLFAHWWTGLCTTARRYADDGSLLAVLLHVFSLV